MLQTVHSLLVLTANYTLLSTKQCALYLYGPMPAHCISIEFFVYDKIQGVEPSQTLGYYHSQNLACDFQFFTLTNFIYIVRFSMQDLYKLQNHVKLNKPVTNLLLLVFSHHYIYYASAFIISVSTPIKQRAQVLFYIPRVI